MVLLLGGSGYIGSAFVTELSRRGIPFLSLSRAEVNYGCFTTLRRLLKEAKVSFLINAAGSTGKPNVDACETLRAEAVLGNVVLPKTVSNACEMAGVRWAQISSGCIYSGAFISEDGTVRVEKDLTRTPLKKLVELRPQLVSGYREEDPPNFTFHEPPCSFYSGTKALCEEILAHDANAYIWRLRIPFDEFDGERNYLSKLQRYERVYENVNSISHRGDFVRACLDLWENKAPLGTYNLTNPGFVTTRQVVDCIKRILKPARDFVYWENDDEFYRYAATTPRSNCVLDTSKLQAAGVVMRPVMDAIEDSLLNWQPAA